IARALGDEVARLHGAPPTELPLLDAVIKESLRLLPPVPIHPRVVAKDTELGGYHFPAGSELMLSIFHLHRDPDVFPTPDVFAPERWQTAKPSVYEYNPFSAGPRMCVGASFAMMELKIVLAMLLSKFRLELPAGSRVDARIAVTMSPPGGLEMIVRSAKDAPPAPSGFEGRVRRLVRWPA
ncbi:MAG TPA: cytochrome P450, partial [Polyangiaceae bacterium]|nr:cytochrome P450 [Polyangiaceae bacterium]